MFFNLDSQNGEIIVELLPDHSDNEPVLQFKLSEVDSTKILIADLSTFPNLDKTLKYRLVIRLVGAELYSFWLSKSRDGHSGGYTAGGGPGLNPKGIDI